MSANPAEHLIALGSALAERMPRVLDAAIRLLESIRRALDAARVERYQIERPLGSGGMAEVFLGTSVGRKSSSGRWPSSAYARIGPTIPGSLRG